MTTIRRRNTVPGRAVGASVLVIDDSDIDREVMVGLLKQAGLLVHDLSSPIGATRTARELQVKLVIVDQNLPSLDGNKLIALLRNNAGTQDIRVVLISSADETSMTQIAREAGADAFVSKQAMHDTLVPTVQRLLGKGDLA